MTQTTQTSTKLDSPWKEMLEFYFQEFMIFFFPNIHTMIDWDRGYEFLDNELQQVVRDAELGRRWADKLVKVWLNDEQSVILYIHIEVQGQYDEEFPKRMYVYNYRLFDRYGQPILSLAILGDMKSEWAPQTYRHEVAGCRVRFDYPVVKLIDYEDHWYDLLESDNPFAIVVRTHLKALRTQNSPRQRLFGKIQLYEALYEKNYSETEILELFRFIDWVLALPEPLELEFKEFVTEYEEKQKMPYITSIERLGRQEGILQRSREAVIEILEMRFERLPETLIEAIKSLKDTLLLSELHKKAVLIESLEKFEQLLKDKTRIA